ncbi:hypothetical protein C8R43DRAFT_964199 [Mycena crocata]|nr:hypothetical protein C8R43DRAFT_964199 [Mycena crocata]
MQILPKSTWKSPFSVRGSNTFGKIWRGVNAKREPGVPFRQMPNPEPERGVQFGFSTGQKSKISQFCQEFHQAYPGINIGPAPTLGSSWKLGKQYDIRTELIRATVGKENHARHLQLEWLRDRPEFCERKDQRCQLQITMPQTGGIDNQEQRYESEQLVDSLDLRQDRKSVKAGHSRDYGCRHWMIGAVDRFGFLTGLLEVGRNPPPTMKKPRMLKADITRVGKRDGWGVRTVVCRI